MLNAPNASQAQSNRACSVVPAATPIAVSHTHTASRGVGAPALTVCHLLVCSALQYPCIEDIVSANPTMTVPVTKVA